MKKNEAYLHSGDSPKSKGETIHLLLVWICARYIIAYQTNNLAITTLLGASPKKSKDSEPKKKKKSTDTAVESKADAQTKLERSRTTSTNVDDDGSTAMNATVSSNYNAEDDVQNNPTNVHSSSQPPSTTEVVLSLRQEPYKSIMHAHFRLFGPNRFTGGSNIEKVVGERILERILSGYYHRDVGDTKSTVVTLYKLNRAGDDVEEIFHSVALRSELCVLY